MIIGPSRPVSNDTIVAVNATTTDRRWSAITGASRRSAVSTDAAGCAWPPLSLYGLVMAGASLGLIDLHVLGTGFEKVLVRAGGQHFPLHQQHDLVVVLDRRDLLRDRDQRQPGIVVAHVLEDFAL